jgi:hypothetical protein
MSILKIASLVVTPNAYEESKILAVVPNNGSGDLDFVRASTKTKVNSQGFIEDLPYNLVSYSEQFQNGYWNKANSTILSTNNLAPNGTNTASRINMPLNNNQSQVFNVIQLEPGTYTTSMWIRLVSGNANFSFGFYDAPSGKTQSIVLTSSWQMFTVTKTISNSSSTRTCWVYSTSADNVIEVWGGQTIKGSVEKPYFPTTNRLNVPSIDYTGGGCPSILLEPQRTNLALYSEDIGNTIYNKGNCFVSSVNNVAPTGNLNANNITSNNTVDAQSRLIVVQSFSAGKNYSASFFIKKINSNNIYVELGSAFMYVNLDTLTTSSSGAFNSNFTYLNSSVKGFINGWVLVHISVTCNVSNTYQFRPLHLLLSDNNNLTLPANSNISYGFYGLQLEEGSFATSYIPTQASAVTRIADSFTKSNIFTNNFITSLGGTWFLELNDNFSLTRDGGGYGIFLGSDNFDPNNLLGIRTVSTGRFTIYKRISTVITDLYNTLTETIKVVFKWNGLNLDVFVNGIKVVSSSSFSITNMEFLVAQGQSTTKNVKSTMLFPTLLSDDECILLSSTSYNTYQEMATALNYVTQ